VLDGAAVLPPNRLAVVCDVVDDDKPPNGFEAPVEVEPNGAGVDEADEPKSPPDGCEPKGAAGAALAKDDCAPPKRELVGAPVVEDPKRFELVDDEGG